MHKVLSATLCPHCAHPVSGDMISPGGCEGWCGHCEQVFQLPLFRVPGWVAGVIAILVLRMYL